MQIRRSPSGDGPTIYRPNEPVPMPLAAPTRSVAYVLTLVLSSAAVAGFSSVVWWSQRQDIKTGGKSLEPPVVQAPPSPPRSKPDNAGGLVPPNQDKEVYNRITPGVVPAQPEKLMPAPTNPKLPTGGLPTPAIGK